VREEGREAVVSEERVIRLENEADRSRAILFLSRLLLAVKPQWEIVIRRVSNKRSAVQNRRYWAVLREISEQFYFEGKRYDSDLWHEHFKRRFIGSEEYELPGGKIEERGFSTTDLNTTEFAEYMTMIEVYASEHGVLFQETRQYLAEWAEQAKRAA
jgi:hypothetical protein